MATDTSNTVSVADASTALDALEAQYSKAKSAIVAVLQSHIADHQKQAAAHAAEIAATQAVLTKAVPTATPAAREAAAFVLTSHSTWIAGVINFLGKNWHYIAIAGSCITVAYGLITGLVHL